MNPAMWPGSGGGGGGGGNPGVGTGTVTVMTLSLASSRSLDNFSHCTKMEKTCYHIDLLGNPTYRTIFFNISPHI